VFRPSQSGVVLRQPARGGLGRRHVLELGQLQPPVELVAVGVEHRRHPPREVRPAPDLGERVVRVRVEQIGALPAEEGVERPGEERDVEDRQVEALGPGRRHDVCGVPGEEEPPVAHRRRHEAAHRRDAPVGHRTGLQRPALEAQADAELVPDPVVRPVLEPLGGIDLQVEPGDRRRPHAVEREAVRVPGVDQLIGGRLDVGEDAEPGERVLALPGLPERGRDGVAAHAVEPVGPDDDVALHGAADAVLVGERDRRPVGGDVVHRGVTDVEEQLLAVGEPCRDEVLDDLGLPVDPHRPAAQRGEVEVVPLPRPLQVDPVVAQALAGHPLPDAGLGEDVDRTLLEDAGPDPRLDVRPGPVLQDDRLDAAPREQLAQRQAGRAGSDDRDLGAHPAIQLLRLPSVSLRRRRSRGRRRAPARRRCRSPPPPSGGRPRRGPWRACRGSGRRRRRAGARSRSRRPSC
jgi:hypothetical protein